MSAITKLLARTPCDAEYESFVDELAAAGYAIVPKEPTAEMIEALCGGHLSPEARDARLSSYRATIAAAKVSE